MSQTKENSKIQDIVYTWVVNPELINELSKKEISKLRIQDIIFSSEKYPYLQNFLNNGVNYPEITHHLFVYIYNIESDTKKLIEEKFEKFKVGIEKEFQKRNFNNNIEIIIIKPEIMTDEIEKFYKEINPNELDFQRFSANLKKFIFPAQNEKTELHFISVLDIIKALSSIYTIIKKKNSVIYCDFDANLEQLFENFTFSSELEFCQFLKYFGDYLENPELLENCSISESLFILSKNPNFLKIFFCSIELIFRLKNQYDTEINFGYILSWLNKLLVFKKEIFNINSLIEYLKETEYLKILEQFDQSVKIMFFEKAIVSLDQEKHYIICKYKDIYENNIKDISLNAFELLSKYNDAEKLKFFNKPELELIKNLKDCKNFSKEEFVKICIEKKLIEQFNSKKNLEIYFQKIEQQLINYPEQYKLFSKLHEKILENFDTKDNILTLLKGDSKLTIKERSILELIFKDFLEKLMDKYIVLKEETSFKDILYLDSNKFSYVGGLSYLAQENEKKSIIKDDPIKYFSNQLDSDKILKQVNILLEEIHEISIIEPDQNKNQNSL